MKMRKCDRCGNLTPERIETVTSFNQAMSRIGELVLDAVNALTGKSEKYMLMKTNGEEIDLCPDCQKSLKAWMRCKHPEETAEEKQHAVEEIHITDTEPKEPCQNIENENMPKFGEF